MAYTITLRDEGPAASASGQTATTDSFTPAANSRLFAFVYARNNGNITDHQFAISDTASLSWTEVAHPALAVFGGEFAARGIMYRANVGGSPASMTVTFDANNTNTDTFFYTWIVFDVTASAGESLGLRQVASNSEVEAEGTSETITATFAAAAETGNLVVACFGADDASGEGMSAPTGFSTLVAQTTHIHAAAFHRSDFTSTAITCPDLGTGPVTSAVVAFELGAFKVAVDAATLTLGGQDVAIAGAGAAVVTVDAAALTLAAQQATLAGTSISVTVDAAASTLVAQDVTATGVTVALTIDPAALTLAGVELAVAGTLATAAIDPAAITTAGQDVVATTGTSTVAVDTASLTIGGQDVLASAGTVIVAIETSTLVLTGVTPTVRGVTVAVTFDAAPLAVTGTDVGVDAVGSAPITIDTAALTTIGQSVAAIGAGMAAVTLDPATVVLLGVAVTVGGLIAETVPTTATWRGAFNAVSFAAAGHTATFRRATATMIGD